MVCERELRNYVNAFAQIKSTRKQSLKQLSIPLSYTSTMYPIGHLLIPIILPCPPIVHTVRDEREDVIVVASKQQTGLDSFYRLLALITIMQLEERRVSAWHERHRHRAQYLYDRQQPFDIPLQADKPLDKQILKLPHGRAVDASQEVQVLSRELERRVLEVDGPRRLSQEIAKVQVNQRSGWGEQDVRVVAVFHLKTWW